MKKTILFIFWGLVGTLYVHAQIPQPDPDTTARHFLQIASIGNLQEVSAGQLAIQKAKRTDVRTFGQMMIKDHGEAEQKLMELVKRKNIDLTRAASGGIQPDLNLKNAGDKFDEMYVHTMLAGHKNTVEVFENYAVTGKDPDVRAFAQQTLPILKQHLAMITAIDKKMKNAATK
ncbi:MAG: DUF4142 domain-containing protein [Mucilaginibacter sp.]